MERLTRSIFLTLIIFLSGEKMPQKPPVISIDAHDMALFYIHKHPDQAFIHFIVDHIDDRNHKSQHSLEHYLELSGFNEECELLKNNVRWMAFHDPMQALKLYRFVAEHSAAISIELYIQHYKNHDAEAFILKQKFKLEATSLNHNEEKDQELKVHPHNPMHIVFNNDLNH